MELLQTFVQNSNKKNIKLSTFIAENEKLIVEDLISKTVEQNTTEDYIKNYWIRIFQHAKKQYDIKDKKLCVYFLKLTQIR
jgi:chorismate mutase